MKLSTAMMLGDSLRERDSYVFLEKRQGKYCGCAIGGAALACGMDGYFDFEKLWPWLRDVRPDKKSWTSWIGVYSVLSFSAVCRGDATFEQLVDYVRSIEPDCGECNRFQCMCAKVSPEVSANKGALV